MSTYVEQSTKMAEWHAQGSCFRPANPFGRHKSRRSPKTGPGLIKRALRFMLPQHGRQRSRILRVFFTTKHAVFEELRKESKENLLFKVENGE